MEGACVYVWRCVWIICVLQCAAVCCSARVRVRGDVYGRYVCMHGDVCVCGSVCIEAICVFVAMCM